MPRRRRRVSWLGLVYFVVVSGLLIGGSVWLDRHGEAVTATVKVKEERVTVQQVPAGAWFRVYRVGVEFDTRDGNLGMASVDLPRDRYDALHASDTIRVRYLPLFPLLARAAGRSTGQTLWAATAAFTADPLLITSLLWLLGGIAALWIASRIATSVIVLVGLAWIALAFPLLPAPRALSPVTADAMARVTSITLVTKAPAKHGAPGVEAASADRMICENWRCPMRWSNSGSRCPASRTPSLRSTRSIPRASRDLLSAR